MFFGAIQFPRQIMSSPFTLLMAFFRYVSNCPFSSKLNVTYTFNDMGSMGWGESGQFFRSQMSADWKSHISMKKDTCQPIDFQKYDGSRFRWRNVHVLWCGLRVFPRSMYGNLCPSVLLGIEDICLGEWSWFVWSVNFGVFIHFKVAVVCFTHGDGESL